MIMRSWNFQSLVALALVFTTTVVTMPLSAADYSKSMLGSVNALGSVELRGIGISQEGTLFAGDNVRTRANGHANLLLSTGDKIEVAPNTDVNVNRDAQGVKIAMNAGTLGFAAHNPLRVDVLPYEVTATDGASGNVVVLNSTTAGVRAISGKVTVRNLKTSESFVLTKGEERLFALPGGVRAASMAELASAAPGPVPSAGQAAPQSTPAGRTAPTGVAMDTGAWIAVIGGVALAGISITALVKSLNNSDDIDDLESRINRASPSIPR
jgi:hypothetical protein